MTFKRTPIGKMRNKIELQRQVQPQERSPTGETIKRYETYATLWAAIRTLSGNERLAAQQVASILTHEISILYRNNINASDRILFGERIFDIKDVRNIDEMNVEIRMRCNEVLK